MDIGRDCVLDCNGKTVTVIFRDYIPELRGCITGMTRQAPNGNFLVVIDSTQPPEKQRYSVGHELAHIFGGDFECGGITTEMEMEAHRKSWDYYRLFRDWEIDKINTLN